MKTTHPTKAFVVFVFFWLGLLLFHGASGQSQPVGPIGPGVDLPGNTVFTQISFDESFGIAEGVNIFPNDTILIYWSAFEFLGMPYQIEVQVCATNGSGPSIAIDTIYCDALDAGSPYLFLMHGEHNRGSFFANMMRKPAEYGIRFRFIETPDYAIPFGTNGFSNVITATFRTASVSKTNLHCPGLGATLKASTIKAPLGPEKDNAPVHYQFSWADSANNWLSSDSVCQISGQGWFKCTVFAFVDSLAYPSHQNNSAEYFFYAGYDSLSNIQITPDLSGASHTFVNGVLQTCAQTPFSLSSNQGGWQNQYAWYKDGNLQTETTGVLNDTANGQHTYKLRVDWNGCVGESNVLEVQILQFQTNQITNFSARIDSLDNIVLHWQRLEEGEEIVIFAAVDKEFSGRPENGIYYQSYGNLLVGDTLPTGERAVLRAYHYQDSTIKIPATTMGSKIIFGAFHFNATNAQCGNLYSSVAKFDSVFVPNEPTALVDIGTYNVEFENADGEQVLAHLNDIENGLQSFLGDSLTNQLNLPEQGTPAVEAEDLIIPVVFYMIEDKANQSTEDNNRYRTHATILRQLEILNDNYLNQTAEFNGKRYRIRFALATSDSGEVPLTDPKNIDYDLLANQYQVSNSDVSMDVPGIIRVKCDLTSPANTLFDFGNSPFPFSRRQSAWISANNRFSGDRDRELKQISTLDPRRFLRIFVNYNLLRYSPGDTLWTVQLENEQRVLVWNLPYGSRSGISYTPTLSDLNNSLGNNLYDGITINYASFGATTYQDRFLHSKYREGKALVSLSGFYNNLYLVHQSRRVSYSSYEDCPTVVNDGNHWSLNPDNGSFYPVWDFVEDTPPQKRLFFPKGMTCGQTQMINWDLPGWRKFRCPDGNGPIPLVDNHMAVYFKTCRTQFTPGQYQRMVASLFYYHSRRFLHTDENLKDVQAKMFEPTARFYPSRNYFCGENEVGVFTPINQAELNSGNTISGYSWDINGLNPSGISSQIVTANFDLTPPREEVGVHEVEFSKYGVAYKSIASKNIYIQGSDCGTLNQNKAENATMIFGTRAKLNFTTETLENGKPVADNSLAEGTSLFAPYGSALLNVTDINKQLYSVGNNVWSIEGNQVNNLTNAIQSYRNSSQQGIFLPSPEVENEYHLFTVPGHDPSSPGQLMKHSFVRSGNSLTLGSLINEPVNATIEGLTVALNAPIEAHDKIASITGCGNHWLLVHSPYQEGSSPNNYLLAIKLEKGEGPLMMVKSPLPPPLVANSRQGMIRASDNGEFVVITYSNLDTDDFSEPVGPPILLRFNKETGEATIVATLGSVDMGSYGAAFSVNGHFVYVNRNDNTFEGVWRYKIKDNLVNNTVVALQGIKISGRHQGYGPSMALQAGQDNKIYVAAPTLRSLLRNPLVAHFSDRSLYPLGKNISVIHFPEPEPGQVNSGLEEHSVSLLTHPLNSRMRSYVGLPTIWETKNRAPVECPCTSEGLETVTMEASCTPSANPTLVLTAVPATGFDTYSWRRELESSLSEPFSTTSTFSPSANTTTGTFDGYYRVVGESNDAFGYCQVNDRFLLQGHPSNTLKNDPITFDFQTFVWGDVRYRNDLTVNDNVVVQVMGKGITDFTCFGASECLLQNLGGVVSGALIQVGNIPSETPPCDRGTGGKPGDDKEDEENDEKCAYPLRKFTIGPGSIFKGICSMWAGIELLGFVDLVTPSTTTNPIEIRDALAGITFTGNAGGSVRHINFINNLVGVSATVKASGPNVAKCYFSRQGQFSFPFNDVNETEGDLDRTTYPLAAIVGTSNVINNTFRTWLLSPVETFRVDSTQIFDHIYGIQADGKILTANQVEITNVRLAGVAFNSAPGFDHTTTISNVVMQYQDYSPIGTPYQVNMETSPKKVWFDHESTLADDYSLVGTMRKPFILTNSHLAGSTINSSIGLSLVSVGSNQTSINASNNVFENYYEAVQMRTPLHSFSFTQNRLVNNNTSISVNTNSSNALALTLQCNQFEQTNSIPTNQERIGLKISQGSNIAGGRIGWDDIDQNPPPNGNYFPRIGTGLSPDPVPGFVSIRNESGNQIQYWHYRNEYVGTVFPAFNSGEPNFVLPEIVQNLTIVSQLNINAWCAANNNCDEPDPVACQQNLLSSTVCSNGLQFRMPCTGGSLDNIEWPLTLPRADTSYISQVKQQEFLYGRHPALSNPIPNPARDVVEFLYFIPSDAKGRQLEITEATTGKVVKHMQVEQMGQHMATISLQGLPAGVYACRLILESGKMPPVQRFVINR